MHFQKYTSKSTIRNFNNAIQNTTRKARLATSRVRQNNNKNHLGQLFTCSLKWASTSFQVPLLSSRAFHSPKTGFCPIHSSQTRKLSSQFAKNVSSPTAEVLFFLLGSGKQGSRSWILSEVTAFGDQVVLSTGSQNEAVGDPASFKQDLWILAHSLGMGPKTARVFFFHFEPELFILCLKCTPGPIPSLLLWFRKTKHTNTLL